MREAGHDPSDANMVAPSLNGEKEKFMMEKSTTQNWVNSLPEPTKSEICKAFVQFADEIAAARKEGCDYAEVIGKNHDRIHFCKVGDTGSAPMGWSRNPNNLQFWI